MNRRTILATTAVLALLALLAAASRRDSARLNAEFFTEMTRSPASRSQSASAVFRNGRTQQAPVPGTASRDFRPTRYGPSDAERRRAARELTNPEPSTIDALHRGETVFRNFCAHCHGPRGRGDGPVAKRVPLLSMSVAGQATGDLPDGELFHIITYGRNNMPPHGAQISPEDRWRLVRYLRDLQWTERDRLDRLGLLLPKDPRRDSEGSVAYGVEGFRANCASCHGEDGRTPKRGVPTLNAPRVLAVADDDYYRDIISHGRRGTAMPAWDQVLTSTEIRSLVLFIRSWYSGGEDRSRMTAQSGDAAAGRALFRGNCAPCHGLNGDGGIGNRLNSPSFQAIASDAFLRDTITQGRSHTGMPSWTDFQPREISDLLAHLRSWKKTPPTFEAVEALKGSASAKTGQKIFRAKCAGCHGRDGEGGIGSRLDGEDFLRRADDRFLYRAIVEGRPGTAMPAWHFLEAADLADLLAHLGRLRPADGAPPMTRTVHGRPEFGELLFQQACQACHGPQGRGASGSQIANSVFLDSASDAFLWDTIAHGKTDTAMRGFLRSTPGAGLYPMDGIDIDHVVAYLRSLSRTAAIDPPRRVLTGALPDLGRIVYEEKGACAKCHGLNGEGASGPALGNPDFLKAVPDGFLTGTILLGRENSEMLSFDRGGNVALTPGEVENVVAYIRSFENRPTVRHRQVDRSPTAVSEGKALYGSYCASCHGSEGRGPAQNRIDGYAPSLNNPEFLRASDDAFLLATIALGRPGTPMRGFARGSGGIADLSADQIRQIVAYIGSWKAPDAAPGPPREEKR